MLNTQCLSVGYTLGIVDIAYRLKLATPENMGIAGLAVGFAKTRDVDSLANLIKSNAFTLHTLQLQLPTSCSPFSNGVKVNL